MYSASIYDYIFQLFNMIQWIMWYGAAKLLFPTKIRLRFLWPAECVLCAIAGYLDAYPFADYAFLRSMSFFVFFGIPVLVFYRGKLSRKAALIILILGTMVLTETALSLIDPARILRVSRRDYSSPEFILFYAVYLFCQAILILAVVFLFQRFEKGSGRYISGKDMFLFLLFPTNQYILLTGWYLNYVEDLSPSQLITLFVVLLFCIASDIILFRMVLRISDNARLKAEKELMARQITAKNEYYQVLADNYRDMSRMRHDIANHVYTVRVLLEDGKRAEALRYAEEIQREDAVKTVFSDCRNSVLRSFLQHRISSLTAAGISVSADVALPAQSGISDVDLIIAFGNLLDNASEASSKTQSPSIQLRAILSNHCLNVECINPCLPNSGKKERRIAYLDRGIGSAILKELARKYDGSFQINIEKNVCSSTLFLKESSSC